MLRRYRDVKCLRHTSLVTWTEAKFGTCCLNAKRNDILRRKVSSLPKPSHNKLLLQAGRQLREGMPSYIAIIFHSGVF